MDTGLTDRGVFADQMCKNFNEIKFSNGRRVCTDVLPVKLSALML